MLSGVELRDVAARHRPEGGDELSGRRRAEDGEGDDDVRVAGGGEAGGRRGRHPPRQVPDDPPRRHAQPEGRRQAIQVIVNAIVEGAQSQW